jgi:SAM-dependent methyltransferase
MKYEDWSPTEDSFLKPMEIEIHESYHRSLIEKYKSEGDIFSPHRYFRIRSLNKALKKTGVISGKVLEIGAGDGWCSAHLLKHYKLSEIFTMEISDAAAKELIPHVFNVCNVDASIATGVKGSFNNIRKTDYFDFVVAMGAIHHSENLFETFRNVYKSLKPGGWFIAQEPSKGNSTRNEFYFTRDEQEIDFKKMTKVVNRDRSDNFYRQCEYQTAAYHAGLNVDVNWLAGPKGLGNWFGLKNLLSGKAKNVLIVGQKPLKNHERIPITSWEYSNKMTA